MKPVFQRVTLLFVVVAVAMVTKAQKHEGLEIGMGIGFNGARVVAPGDDNINTRFTFNSGFSGEYYFSGRWGAKLKLLWDNKGFSNGTIIDMAGNTLPTDIHLSYLTMPFMANWHFSKHRRWYLSFGPYVGLLLSTRDTRLGVDIKSQINSFDAGVACCIGYKYEISNNTKLYLEMDGQYGIKNIITGDYRVWNTRSAYNFGVLIDL